MLFGGIWLFGASVEKEGTTRLTCLVVGSVYMVTGLLPCSRRRTPTLLATVAWYPLLIIFPLGTVCGLHALKVLRSDPDARRKAHEETNEMSPQEIENLIRRSAYEHLGIDAAHSHLPLKDLKVPLGDFDRFLDDLQIDYGLKAPVHARNKNMSIEGVIEEIQAKR
jgi:hypothetical protein